MESSGDVQLRLGDLAPNFDAETSQGPLNLYDYKKDSWLIFFSHPSDYTPVCTTELGTTAKMIDDFAKRNCKVIALSVDDVESHKGWIKDIEETQNATVTFPIIADPDRVIAKKYGMIHPNSPDTAAGKMTVRTVWILDPNNKIRLNITYPAATGRNFHEILRVLDALQLTDNYKVATPANWEHGQDTVVLPTIPTEEAKKIFPKGVTEIKPYLRLTPQPNLE
ncbi:Antioxidant protein rehydrin [Balamuthia mandrillaris]